MSEERATYCCEVCGQPVKVVSSGENTSHEAERDALREQVRVLKTHMRRMRFALVVCRDNAQSAERWKDILTKLLRENEDDLPTLAEVSGIWATPEQEG